MIIYTSIEKASLKTERRKLHSWQGGSFPSVDLNSPCLLSKGHLKSKTEIKDFAFLVIVLEYS